MPSIDTEAKKKLEANRESSRKTKHKNKEKWLKQRRDKSRLLGVKPRKIFNTEEERLENRRLRDKLYKKNKRKDPAFHQKEKEINKKSYHKNFDQISEKRKKHYFLNIEKYRKKNKEYRLENIEIFKESARKSYFKHRDKRLEGQRKWHAKNKEHIIEYRKKTRSKANIYERKKALNDINFRLARNLRRRIRYALVSKNIMKTKTTMNLIGCSATILKNHLESLFNNGMNWENYGVKGWHVDHIMPCAAFDLSKESEQKKCFHYSNLQPLWAIENFKKGARY